MKIKPRTRIRKLKVIVLGAITHGFFLAIATTLVAADQKVNTKCEMSGTVETEIVAVGGETTGIVIHTEKGDWELDFQNNQELQRKAGSLNKKTIVVVGTCKTIAGVEKPERHIIEVTRLRSATKK
jgi:hypothetical protein